MMTIVRSRLSCGLLVGFALAAVVGLMLGLTIGAMVERAEAVQVKPKAGFINLVTFPPIKPGKDTEFMEWFRWSNDVYAKHKGFISRSLLKPTDTGTYAAIVEHESKETFMAMHHSQDREEAFKRVEPLFDGRPTPHFYEVVISHGK